MQCLQYQFYNLLSVQKHRIRVKGHQNIIRPQEFYRAGTAPPGFEISGSATASVYLKDIACLPTKAYCAHFRREKNYIFRELTRDFREFTRKLRVYSRKFRVNSRKLRVNSRKI